MYDEGYYRYRESTRDFRSEAELLYAMLMPQPGSRILEVGCGGGAFLAFLEDKGVEATGVDISEEALRLASQIAAASRVVEADAADLPFEDASFDRLVSHHLVEHLPDLQKALGEWNRVLEPDGILALCTPNGRYPSPDMFFDLSHLHLYMPEELKQEVEKAGFSVDRSVTIFPHLFRDRISVALGVPLYGIFSKLPYYRDRGRSLLLSAHKS